jgi:hypothetical protein
VSISNPPFAAEPKPKADRGRRAMSLIARGFHHRAGMFGVLS